MSVRLLSPTTTLRPFSPLSLSPTPRPRPRSFPPPCRVLCSSPSAPNPRSPPPLLRPSLPSSSALRCTGLTQSESEGAGAGAGKLEKGILDQMKEIVVFAGPAVGLWICGPLMSLIDTMVIGQSSSLELAALGPGTVFCDYLCYIFMFLSIATSNMVATSLAKQDRELAQHQISMLLFVALASGLGMFLFTKFLGPQVLAGFVGPENFHLISAANTYVQIRGFAWPAVLVGMVAQSARLENRMSN